ncbi:type III secretion protein Q [Hydrogenophaga palleronii]|uniref:Type III secretion protein Q n=1 Tax=Hydrogenophaga palleronii TaxID=65655 RepID=A0ABU1WKX3_9BURK|nr:type III secretion system cytoplasmic ring protein SctQ [Hydrogenophaga palleronii]MDR7149945.1 type III secretion protein Q [Hydrogenophaga palleronii]
MARHLPSLEPAAARATRVGFDRRLQGWLSRQTGLAGIQVYPAHAPAELLQLDIACAHGDAAVALDPAQWPALQMVAGLEDRALARDVTDALLAPALHHLSALLPGARVRTIGRYSPTGATGCAPPCIGHGEGEVTLVQLSRSLAAHVGGVLHEGVAPDLGRLQALRVPMRVTLFERLIRRHRLAGLSAGDVVLIGAAQRTGTQWQATLKFGLGIIMQAHADIDFDQPHAYLTEAPHTVEDDPASAAAELSRAPVGIEDLQVPVAFEIDSARVSLGELACLGEGSVIELDVGLMEASVRLVCHGQTIGQGQLVAVGEQLGVRIVQMGPLGSTAKVGVAS